MALISLDIETPSGGSAAERDLLSMALISLDIETPSDAAERDLLRRLRKSLGAMVAVAGFVAAMCIVIRRQAKAEEDGPALKHASEGFLKDKGLPHADTSQELREEELGMHCGFLTRENWTAPFEPCPDVKKACVSFDPVKEIKKTDDENQIGGFCKVINMDNDKLRSAVAEYFSKSGRPLSEFEYGPIEIWNTSSVTDMANLFKNRPEFNADISKWDTGKVTDMSFMFYGAKKFNGNLETWNTTEVRSTSFMFYDAEKFNGNLKDWNTKKVKDMSYMFFHAKVFNGDLSGWNTGQVRSTSFMFYDAEKFNGNLKDWNTAEVKLKAQMFAHSGMKVLPEWYAN